MTTVQRVLFALCVCSLASPVLAQAGSTLAQMVHKGQAVEVIDDEGRETRGTIGVVSGSALQIVGESTTIDVPFDRITQIARPADTLANGAWIGLAAGVAFGVLGAAADNSRCDSYCFDGPGYVIGSGLIFGGIGAGIGVGVDALVRHKRIIYRRGEGTQTRLAPVVGRGVKGAVLSVSW